MRRSSHMRLIVKCFFPIHMIIWMRILSNQVLVSIVACSHVSCLLFFSRIPVARSGLCNRVCWDPLTGTCVIATRGPPAESCPLLDNYFVLLPLLLLRLLHHLLLVLVAVVKASLSWKVSQ